MEEFFRERDVFIHALHVAIENLKGGRDGGIVVVAVEDEVAEGVAVLGGEFVDVALQEEQVGGVEGKEIIFQPALGHLGRDGLLQVVILLEQFGDDVADVGVAFGMDGDRLDRREIDGGVGVGCGRIGGVRALSVEEAGAAHAAGAGPCRWAKRAGSVGAVGPGGRHDDRPGRRRDVARCRREVAPDR